MAGVREFQQRRSQPDREQENERRLKRQKLEAKPLELTALRTKKIYISKRASNDYDQDYLNRQAEKLGATVIQDMVGAGIMVVPGLDPVLRCCGRPCFLGIGLSCHRFFCAGHRQL